MEEKLHTFNEYFEGTGYIAPCFMFNFFANLIKEYGEDNVLKSNKFKRWREAHITATFLLGLSEITGIKYWLSNNPEQSTPDTFGIFLERIQKGIKRNILNIEIFEWEKHFNNDLVEAIKSKLKNKKYPEYYILLCLINREDHKRINLSEVHKKLKDEKIRVSEIWLLSSISDKNYDTMIAKIFPKLLIKNFKIEDLITKNGCQEPMIKITGRGKGKNFVPLGKALLPLRPY
jgi:hypothetical protein